MYLNEDLKQPDGEQFVKAMIQEVEGQVKNGNF
jgi:hypothetical protein